MSPHKGVPGDDSVFLTFIISFREYPVNGFRMMKSIDGHSSLCHNREKGGGIMVTTTLFGVTADGRNIDKITFTDGSGNCACVISYGAVLQALTIHGTDVCLGYDTVGEYEAANSCFGSTMGRCTNRIGGARFTLSGKTYHVSENRKGFQIHGGFQGFHKKVWDYEIVENGVMLTYCSPNGEEGYPGNVTATVTYRWAEPGVLELTYDCVSDAETVINLTNHSYFNLNGHDSGSAEGHSLQIFADTVAETGENGIPTGKLLSVEGTPLDFRTPTVIGSRINGEEEILTKVGGYDHNFPLSGNFSTAAILRGDSITMTVKTDLPDLGLYAANFLAEQPGKGGAHYGRRHGICLETQYMPNAVNLPDFSPKPVFKAGEHMKHKTQFIFTLL